MTEPTVIKNEDQKRYEIHLGGERIGFAAYRRDGDVVELPHTVVEPAHGGKGHAGRLVEFALRDIREQGLSVRPTCSYVADYIRKHPEWEAALEA